jgi:hypothetical protein
MTSTEVAAQGAGDAGPHDLDDNVTGEGGLIAFIHVAIDGQC